MTTGKDYKNGNDSHKADEIRQAEDFGLDIYMLMENIKRKPAERIRRHQIALNTAEKLRKAKPI